MAQAAFSIIVIGSLLSGFVWYRFGTPFNALAYMRGERLHVASYSQDLGIVPVGAERTAYFDVTNLSSAPAKVMGTAVPCSCTTIDEMPERFPTAVTQTIGFRFTPNAGQISDKYVGRARVFTDNPHAPQLEFSFSARVTPSPSAYPAADD